jgi:hypothetical protein
MYSLRYSHTLQALLNGVNLKLLAENLGTSVRMIELHYGQGRLCFSSYAHR